MFWLSGGAVSAISGLFIAGLGVANLFPLSLALTLAAAPRQTDTANARTQLLGGLLVVSAPFLLGALADRIGLRAAFIVVPALILISAALLLAAQRAERAARRTAEGRPAPGGADGGPERRGARGAHGQPPAEQARKQRDRGDR